MFGYISDRTKSKLGRRIPYIRYGAILIAGVFILSWVQWFSTGSNVQMFAQMLISLFFFDMLHTAIATSLYVMPYEMAVTNEARGKILFVKVIFGLVSVAVPLVLLAQLEKYIKTVSASFPDDY
ncbi:MAG: MFS transporter [Roseburia faecis]